LGLRTNSSRRRYRAVVTADPPDDSKNGHLSTDPHQLLRCSYPISTSNRLAKPAQIVPEVVAQLRHSKPSLKVEWAKFTCGTYRVRGLLSTKIKTRAVTTLKVWRGTWPPNEPWSGSVVQDRGG
jgi:hypothetical protein